MTTKPFENVIEVGEARYTCSIQINPENKANDTRMIRDIANTHGQFLHVDADRGEGLDFAICLIAEHALDAFKQDVLSRPQPSQPKPSLAEPFSLVHS